MEVVVLILKHATILQLSNTPEQALTLAEKDYRKAKINSKIQEHLRAFTAEDSVEKFAAFIMATNIGLFMHSSITTISHHSLHLKQLHREEFGRLIPVKFIFCQWLRNTRRKEKEIQGWMV